MIEVKLSTLVDSIKTMNYLVKLQFKVYTAYKIARLVREISKELELFNEAKQALAKKYGEFDQNGNILLDENGNYKIKEECVNDFVNEYQALLSETVTLNAEPIPLKELEDKEFTPSEIESIIDFIA